MTANYGLPSPSGAEPLDPEVAEQLIKQLRQKIGSWVEWGKACQRLQKAGHNPQAIFEQTGFEPIQQNQVIVGMQVYETMVKGNANPETLDHFQKRGSDSLYELRLLTQPERVAAAEWLVAKKLDSEAAHEMTRAIKQFNQLRTPPEGFVAHPGDAMAFHAWRLAQQTSDLPERSRLIAQGLRTVYSETARHQLEQLLMNLTAPARRMAPRMSVYRLESAQEVPWILPVVGRLPLTVEDLQSVPVLTPEPPFGIQKSDGPSAWVALPSWTVLRQAEDPIGLIANSQDLPNPDPLAEGDVLVLVDRGIREWQDDAYFLVDGHGSLQVEWFETDPGVPLFGRILVVVRPPRLFDDEFARDQWQIEE